MKPTKPTNAGLPQHGHSSRPGQERCSSQGNKDTMSENRSGNAAGSSATQSLVHSQVTNVLVRENSGGMEAMRRRMGAALAQKQQRRAAAASSSSSPELAKEDETPELPAPLVHTESSSDESVNTVHTGTMSTDSTKTIKAAFDTTPGAIRTPSYPFPRMSMRLNRGVSQRSGPSHKPFTLLSPTNEPAGGRESSTIAQPRPEPQREASSSDLSTPLGQTPMSPAFADDPNFPTPDLYDIILMLNSEPGLDMWWANVTEILSEAYGAERASLAIPGDITDLENVPWGQKATYNICGAEGVPPSRVESLTASEADATSVGRRPEPSSRMPSDASLLAASVRRPPLLSRHSIAGPVPEASPSSSRQRPAGPVRAHSSIPKEQEEENSTSSSSVLPRLTRQAPTPQSFSAADTDPSFKGQYYSSGSGSSTLRCHVHRSIQPLEAETDPLLVRTGVVALFGKRKPIVLTRAYTDTVPSRSPTIKGRDDDRTEPPTPSTAYSEGSLSFSRPTRAFDDLEQPEPSPWSQSPSPSPAARPDPAESPFFVQPTASIDEAAFEQNPPPYDYATSANQSLTAIGADMSKTLIHLPLIQPVLSRGALASNLRFPTAILSFLTPLTPYPRSLRRSLEALVPHLASSYSLAQQYSALQDRSRGSPSNRHGAAFGLGGTFSDEGSELELVAELSGQLAQDKEKSRAWRSQEGDSPALLRESPHSSVGPSPLMEHLGLSPGPPATPGKSGTEMLDSYFSLKRHRTSQQPLTPGQRPNKDELAQSKRSFEKAASSTRQSSKKASGSMPKTLPEPSSPLTTRSASNASENELGDSSWSFAYDRFDSAGRRQPQRRESQLRDDDERPLPELISSLMLNAVPLQLFLAKPGTGDLVWTNRKFDAFRSQGEGRVRDPWKNVHPEDRNGLVKLWNDALRTGSQFTHYIRVKRFNSDSDYRWFVFRASTLLSNNGRLLYWIGSFLDVHEQYMKNLEASEKEAILAHDTKIRALADAIPQVLFEAIEGDGIVAVNQQWHAYSGQTLEDARGLGFAKHVHREDLHKCGILSPSDVAAIARSSTSGSQTDSSGDSNRTAAPPLPAQNNLFSPDPSSLDRMIKQGAVLVEKDENGRLSYLTEIRLRSKGGEYRWFLVRLVRVDTGLWQSQSGRASWYGTCTDIETRKNLERELNQANHKVHSEMESKTKFFANMSHEIRTPLNGILGSMPWLVESTLDHDQRRTVDTIQNSANNLRELVDNILDVTKVEAGKMTLLPKWFHVRTLCEEVIDTVSSRAIERGLELNYSLDANVPSMVKGDAFRVRQVLLNLLGNSVKFTEQGEVYMRCSLREEGKSSAEQERPTTALLSFDVVDTGRGFNENEFQRLFKQFGQIGGGSNHEAGSGLGLFLSKQLVEMHGGELSVKSQAGEGSTFSFYIKVELAPPGSDVQSPPATVRPGQQRLTPSVGGSPRSRSDNRTPTMASARGFTPSVEGIIQTPGLSRYTSSPDNQPVSLPSPAVPSPLVSSPPVVSPPAQPSESSAMSTRSNSGNIVLTSSISSQLPTPESAGSRDVVTSPSEPQSIAAKMASSPPVYRRSKSDNDGGRVTPETAHPQTYSIIIICPAEHARTAIKQHIEHVVPYQIAANVTTIPDIGSFLGLMNGPSPPAFTHVVLDIPATSDIMLFMRRMVNWTGSVVPALVIITDHYQKRDILEDFTMLTASGRKAFLIHKPVKPSVFAMIFDPAQLRNLSKDRAREVAQSSSDDFRHIAKLVKDKVGGREYRVLLVEDSDVNRMVIQRYLNKVALENDSAKNGQECVDMVQARGPGYYSLIICDIQMPIKNGYDACREIREWEKSHGYRPSPIMALTANAMPEERAAAANAGFTDYLTKPVDFNVLGTMMMTLLDPSVPHVFLRDRPLES
ncbi:Peroxide stress-activated histidine kinase mak1 [Exophiala dermatitidis]